jgi:UDP-2,4-diacetamido-2,4,6-trideoxy-beta-L-altropyranose hydrolase
MIVFRCNASPKIGIGHLMRCRSLAIACKKLGLSCSILGPPDNYKVEGDDALFDYWVEQSDWVSETDDAEKLILFSIKVNAKALIIDDYKIKESYQKILKKSKIPWMQFDYTYQILLWADIVLNSNITADIQAYKKLKMNPKTRFLLGAKYALLRPEFTKAILKKRKTVERILITFGGGDDRGAILFSVRAALDTTPKNIELVIVSGKDNPRTKEIQEWVHVGLYLGELSKINYIDICHQIDLMIKNYNKYLLADNIVDGCGSNRVASEINNCIKESS